MAATSSDTQNNYTIRLKAYNDCDNVHLCWRVLNSNGKDAPLPGCLGFKIERQRFKQGRWQKTEVLRNRVGFGNEIVDENDLDQTAKPSSVRPFQRYDWTDHGANINETVRYRVVAMSMGQANVLGTDELTEISDSGWTDKIEVNADAGDGISVFFNRGTVMSQYVARIARKNKWSAADIKNHISEIEEPLRIFLSGELRNALLKILDDTIANPFYSVYAALYELSDKELIGKLKLIRSRANIVLSDGSNSAQEDGHTVYVDGNADARDKLNKAGVNVFDRILGAKGLGHNKFLVLVDNRTDEPLLVWTGSTNWSPTGLCTQLNNGVLIQNPGVASIYYEQWKKLQAAGNGFPEALVASNSSSPGTVGNMDVWFTRGRKPVPAKSLTVDIAALKQMVDEAETSILYVMFQPGLEPLQSILERRTENDFYVKGVVSTVIAANKEQFALSGGTPYTMDLKQPEGIGRNFKWWIKEVTRGQFIPYGGRPGIGFAITHAKMIVIDPFSDHSKVITGSHNFSKSASIANDENFVVIRNNRKLAEHYAVACMAMYNHYRWRAYLKEKFDAGEDIWSHLSDDPKWQSDYLRSNQLMKQLKTWC